MTAAWLTQTSNNAVPIQEAPFQSEVMHLPISLGRPVSRLQRLDLIIHFASNSFNLCFTQSAMPCRAWEESAPGSEPGNPVTPTEPSRNDGVSRWVYPCVEKSVMQFALWLILRYLADALNCLYFFGDARWLEPLILQNNYLIYCRRMIDQNVTEISWESRLVPIYFALHAWTCFEGSFRYLFEATSVLLLLFYVIIIFDVL